MIHGAYLRRLMAAMRIQDVTFRTLLLATTGIAGLVACGSNRGAPPPQGPVRVARAERRAVPYELEATGTVEAIRAVDVMPQVNGTILRVNFREGDEVGAGQVLFEIDPRPYRAALQQSEAALLRDLTQARSAAREAARYRELAVTNTVTQEDYEQKQATADAAAALVQSDSAAASLARLNLDYATVRAPIGGRTGRLLLHEGNVVRAGSDPLVSIVQIRPILVRFPVPATNLPALRKRAGQELVVIAMPSRDSAAAVRGVLSFVDNQVDTTTGSVLLKARFANQDKGLWPGEFVSVTLVLGMQEEAAVRRSAGRHGNDAAGDHRADDGQPDRARRRARRDGGGDGRTAASHAQCQGGDSRRAHDRDAGRSGAVNISGLFIRRPVATTLVMLGILMFGIMAYRLLPVSDLPNVDYPTITVSAGLSGASPQTMAAAVATPLEKQFSTIAGIDAMTSTSTLGGTNITLTFALSRNIDDAAADVQAAISKTLRQLPPGIQPPSYNKSNPADSQ